MRIIIYSNMKSSPTEIGSTMPSDSKQGELLFQFLYIQLPAIRIR